MPSATTPAAFSANTPAFAIGMATQSPTAYTSGNGVSSVSRSTATQPSRRAPIPRRLRARGGSGCRRRGRTAAARRSRARPLCAAVSSSTTRCSARYSIPRASSSSRKRCETSGVTGTGADIGAIDRGSRLPPGSRARRAGRGAGTRPRTAPAGTCTAGRGRRSGSSRPRTQAARVAHPLGSGDRVVLEAALLEARRRGDVVLGAERDDEDVRVVRAWSVVTRRAAGSIAVTRSWRNSTPGFASSLYGIRTAAASARPKRMSSFEKPNVNRRSGRSA